MNASRKSELLSKTVSPEEVVITGPYTKPRTFGVYQLLGKGKSGRSHRFGNHPVRMNELARDYGKVELVALFLDRRHAAELATIENEIVVDAERIPART